jgi:hypothetical protein
MRLTLLETPGELQSPEVAKDSMKEQFAVGVGGGDDDDSARIHMAFALFVTHMHKTAR